MTNLTIQQTSEETGVSVHTLRYYERAGLISPVNRAPNGHRRYSAKDVYNIIFLTRLRATGMPIADIKRYVDLAEQGGSTIAERLDLLKEHRARIRSHLEEVTHYLSVIERKIDHYQEQYQGQLKGATGG